MTIDTTEPAQGVVTIAGTWADGSRASSASIAAVPGTTKGTASGAMVKRRGSDKSLSAPLASRKPIQSGLRLRMTMCNAVEPSSAR